MNEQIVIVASVFAIFILAILAKATTEAFSDFAEKKIYSFLRYNKNQPLNFYVIKYDTTFELGSKIEKSQGIIKVLEVSQRKAVKRATYYNDDKRTLCHKVTFYTVVSCRQATFVDHVLDVFRLYKYLGPVLELIGCAFYIGITINLVDLGSLSPKSEVQFMGDVFIFAVVAVIMTFNAWKSFSRIYDMKMSDIEDTKSQIQEEVKNHQKAS